MIKVKYLVIGNQGLNSELMEELMLKDGEIMQSWVAGKLVHHLIKYEDK